MDNILKSLDELELEALRLLITALDTASLETVSINFLGRKGKLAEISRQLGQIENSLRPAVGARLNEIRKKLTEAADAKKSEILNMAASDLTLDYTLPGRRNFIGHKHPLMDTVDNIIQIFRGMGFAVASGPDIETNFYNFDALNTPESHPARDLSDTFYIDHKKGFLLRTHTSTVQIRTMQSQQPPVRVISPGRCYRSDAPDASHSPVFFQCEGLFVDRNVTFGDLKGVITVFAHQMFGEDVKVRFRPHFFPFTEPSAEYDFSCMICGGTGCRVCKHTGWVEISGAGMVDPEVFKAVGYDPEIYIGYAFGMGVDRITMLRFGINDIRLLYENDIRFLRQF